MRVNYSLTIKGWMQLRALKAILTLVKRAKLVLVSSFELQTSVS